MNESMMQVHRILDKLQSGASGKFVVYEPVPTGLGGQISGRIAALLVGIVTGRAVIFPRLDDLPYGQSFEPMSVPDETISTIMPDVEQAPDITWDRTQSANVIKLSPFRTSLRTEVAERTLIEGFRKATGLPSITRLEAEGLIRGWMRLTSQMEARLAPRLDRFAITRRTLGVHVRRGDKNVETAFIPIKEIERRVAQLVNDGNFESVFLASDSADVIESFRVPRGVTLIADREEKRYNNANHKMLFNRHDMREQETETALFNIEALSRCGGLIGQDNAHFAVISAGVVSASISSKYIYLFPGDYAEQVSSYVRIVSLVKRKARAVARKILPWATLANRAKQMTNTTNV